MFVKDESGHTARSRTSLAPVRRTWNWLMNPSPFRPLPVLPYNSSLFCWKKVRSPFLPEFSFGKKCCLKCDATSGLEEAAGGAASPA